MGIPVAVGGAAGGQVDTPGQLQYGPLLLGSGTSAGWRELVGWRDHPSGEAADSQRTQAHGAFPGSVYGDALTVTFTYLVRGTPEVKAAAIATIEQWTRMDGIDRPLVVDDGGGPELRMARVIARTVPQDRNYRQGPVECSVQFLCADPRRYSLAEHSVTVRIPVTVGGLEYPLEYPLDYGTSVGGSRIATNDGGEHSPLRVVFRGPLSRPVLSCPSWRLGFDLVLAEGEALEVTADDGTAVLNGAADRLYTIRRDSDPVDAIALPPGDTNLTLTAAGGTGTAEVLWRDARM